MTCQRCGARAYGPFCFRCRPRKPIPKIGKQGKKYAAFRTTEAIPYLDKTYGHVCSVLGCRETDVDIDHIEERGSRPRPEIHTN